jgi:hypothetical protein
MRQKLFSASEACCPSFLPYWGHNLEHIELQNLTIGIDDIGWQNLGVLISLLSHRDVVMHPMKSHRSCCFTRVLLRAGKNVRTSG